MTARHLLHSLAVIILLFSTDFAQTPTPSPQTDEQRKAQKEIEAKALGLLEDVIKDSESFKNAENRIRIRAAAASVLWTHDQDRARVLFKEAMTSLVDLLNNQETGDVADNPKMFEGPRQLRRELLQMLGQRDAKLARELMHATRQQNSQPANPRSALPDQLIEMGLATQIAATDPKQALEMAEETLSRGLSFELPQLISALREKDPEAAAKLASQAVAKIRTEGLDSSQVARQVAVFLLREAHASEENGQSAKNAAPLLDEQTRRELAEMLVAEALRPSSTSPELLGLLQEIMPIVEKYAPARVAQLRRKVAQTVAHDVGDTGNANDWSEYLPLLEKGSVDELLEAASKAPEGIRETLYQRVAAKLMEEGDQDRARQAITERVTDPAQRKQMLAQLDEIAAFKAAEHGKIDQTRKLLATLRTSEERVMVLAQLATSAAARGEKKIALQLLDETRTMISARAKNFKQLGAQLAVARAYAPLEASRSLAILEPVVDQLNELLAAAVVLGAFITDEMIKDDEITMEPLTMLSNELFVHYLNDVSTLARADFERIKALADRFHRDEIRVIARLLIAQSILSPQPATDKASFFGIDLKGHASR